MRTTTVVRGGEWLASVPIHYELFHVLGFKMPKYAHTAHLMKFDEETGGKRKLSKRRIRSFHLITIEKTVTIHTQ